MDILISSPILYVPFELVDVTEEMVGLKVSIMIALFAPSELV